MQILILVNSVMMGILCQVMGEVQLVLPSHVLMDMSITMKNVMMPILLTMMAVVHYDNLKLTIFVYMALLHLQVFDLHVLRGMYLPKIVMFVLKINFQAHMSQCNIYYFLLWLSVF